MSTTSDWWNRLSRAERNAVLQASHLSAGLSLYTWHILHKSEQERILNYLELGDTLDQADPSAPRDYLP